MAKRGVNRFRRNDAIRAIKSARDAGVNVSGVDVVVAPDGTTTFRVYGREAMPTPTPEIMSAKEWDEEFAKLKKPPKRE